MDITAKPYFDQKNLEGIDDVLQAFERLGHDLPAARMDRLDHFNQTYLIITRNVRQRLKAGDFDHPEFLERFDARFAYYYLHALEDFLHGREVPPAWHRAFRAAERPYASPIVCMALGVNAHVNNDIPQVLRDCGASREHYRDYLLVNGIIRRSLDEVIALFADERRVLSPHRRLTRPVFKLGMHLLVRLWRRTAWRKFRKLSRHKLDVALVEDKANRTAKGVSKLPV